MPKAKKRPRSAMQAMAYTIKEFCDAHAISVTMYYSLKRDKKAPREMTVGKRHLISAEAAAEWRAAREG